MIQVISLDYITIRSIIYIPSSSNDRKQNPLDPHSITVKYPEISLAGKPPRFNGGFPSIIIYWMIQ